LIKDATGSILDSENNLKGQLASLSPMLSAQGDDVRLILR